MDIKVEALAALELKSGQRPRRRRANSMCPAARSDAGGTRPWRRETGRNLLPVEGDWGEWRERAADAYFRTALKTQVIMEKEHRPVAR